MTDRTPNQDFDFGGTHTVKNMSGGSLVPDPSGEPDGQVLETSGGALVYGAGGGGDVAGDTHAATSKTTPVDNDEIPLADSAASYGLKKLLWSNLKATLKSYFDTLYPSGSGTVSGTNTGDQTSVSGNAGTATKLATARNIDGQSFDGSANITVIAPGTHAASSKATPVDADELSLVDSAASNVLKKVTWANLKATLKTYFDTLYAPAGAASIGGSSLVYRYTVTGSDKASIDTGVDTPDAGSNDWSNGDLLEVFMAIRTDEAAADVAIDVTLNNDSGAHYDRQTIRAQNTTFTGTPALAASSWHLSAHGSGGSASYPAVVTIAIPDFAGTALFKVATSTSNILDSTAANVREDIVSLGWRDTSAITRLAVAAAAGQKLKVGSQLLIYKRVAS